MTHITWIVHKFVAAPLGNSVKFIIIPYVYKPIIIIIISILGFFYLSIGFCDVCGQPSNGRVCNFLKRAEVVCLNRWQVGQCLQKRPVSIHVGGICTYMYASVWPGL